MSINLEYKKIRRTGFFPALAAGGILAAAFPLLNMSFRSELFTGLDMPEVQILMENNWEMITMLNLVLLLTGACILYHIEFADNGIQKMHSLPRHETSLFFGKTALLLPAFLFMLAVETGALIFCGIRWFSDSPSTVVCDTLPAAGFALLLSLPALVLSLVISSLCENMWVMLGIGVLCIFTASMLPADNFALSLFPYALPFQILPGMTTAQAVRFCAAAAAETVIICGAEFIIVKARRFFS